MTNSNPEFSNEAGDVVCPNSLDHADLTTNYKLHHCSPDELKKFGGVCQACFDKFRKNNSAALAGKTETPVDMNKKEHGNLSLEQDHVAFTETSESELVEFFPFDDLDKDTAEFFANASPDVQRESAMALGLILAWVWQSGFETAQRKFAAMTAGLRPDLLDDASYAEIAAKLGCVKATISKAAMSFQERFNMKFSRSRQDETRRKMADARRGKPGNNRRKERAP
jgi:hypothetical protein